MYRENLRQLKKMGLLGMVVGLVLGIVIGIDTGGIDAVMVILFAIFFAGMPYGWVAFGKVFNFMLVGSIPVVVIGFMLRFFCAIVIGWFIYPVVLIYTIIRAKRESK